MGLLPAAHEGGELGESVHVAAVRVPAVQELIPETVYPELHVGWQVDPLGRVSVQLPTPPFVGAATPSHEIACFAQRISPRSGDVEAICT